MKNSKTYLTIFTFLFAIGSVLASKASFIRAPVQGYHMYVEGGSISNPQECGAIKPCEPDGPFWCRYKPTPTAIPIDLFQDDGNGICDFDVYDTVLIE